MKFGALWVGLGGTAVVALALTQSGSLDEAPLNVPVYGLALAFGLCEFLALRVVRRQAQVYGFALAEVPLAIGLIYAGSTAVVVARVLAVAVVLVLMRRPAIDAVVELGVAAVQTLTAVAVFTAVLGDVAPIGWRGAAAAVAGLAAAHGVASAALVLVVAAGGWPGGQSVRQMLAAGTWAAAFDAVIGIGLALIIWRVPYLWLVVATIAVVCVWSNRLYTRLAEHHRRLGMLHTFAGSVVRSVDLAEVAASVLQGAKSLLRADDAVLLLAPVNDGDDASRLTRPAGDDGTMTTVVVPHDEFTADLDTLVPGRTPRVVVAEPDGMPAWLAALGSGRALAAPLTNAAGDLSGALVVSQSGRRSTFGFGDDQADLLGHIADHASMALENGALFARLRHDAESRAHQLTHDTLTDLPNRERLIELLDEAVDGVDGVSSRIGLLVIDLDEFSQVSDAFGHRSTDELLVQACERIDGLLPSSATLCRIGPNEFAAILRDIDTADEAERAARLLIAGFDPPFRVEGVVLALSVNIGVAVYPVHAVDVPSLVQRTHIARDTARRLRSRCEVYDPAHDPATPRRLALGAELREAIESSDLDVCFQPKVEVTTGVVRGAEALVRWEHPRLGRVRPSEFIAVAEHTGDIRNLTMVVMRRSLTECRSWRDRGLGMSVAVNLSARNLLDLNLVDDVALLLDDVGVPPEALTLELTESMVMSESQRSVTVLEGLDDLGVCLSCDDFGTGYSSLAHLRRLPIGEIKIDRSFIARMTHEESDRAIARSVLALGTDLGLTTVAEGVESSSGLELLGELGCDLAQGFYVCPPLAVSQFEQWLAQRAAVEMPA